MESFCHPGTCHLTSFKNLKDRMSRISLLLVTEIEGLKKFESLKKLIK